MIDTSLRPTDLRVLIVAPNASAVLGGETILPLHYFRQLRACGIEAWLLVHARRQPELDVLLATERHRIHYVSDTWLDQSLSRLWNFAPGRLAQLTVCFADLLLTQFKQRPIIRQLLAQHRINLIHEPIPVSPKAPSALVNLGVPVVIGPMNGGMDYPPGFLHTRHRLDQLSVFAGRLLANLANQAFRGKLQASTLLVANARTRQALPWGVRGQILELVENAVDFSVWTSSAPPSPATTPTTLATTSVRLSRPNAPVHFAFLGRLVDWKCADLLLRAFRPVLSHTPAHLTIIGDGPERPALEALAIELRLQDHITFTGWLPQPACARRLEEADVLVLPSILECGGSAILEAMAMGLPIIATHWGGPADYLDASCGILVDPVSPDHLVTGLTRAMIKLAESPTLRTLMGHAGQRRARERFCWQRKIERILEIYQEAIRQGGPSREPATSGVTPIAADIAPDRAL